MRKTSNLDPTCRRMVFKPLTQRLTCREPNDKPRADQAAVDITAILGANGAAMGVDDLLRDGEPEAGVGPELLADRSFAVEALEDRFELALGKSGAFILNRDHHRAVLMPCRKVDRGTRRAEGNGVVDEIAEHLDQPPLDAEDRQIALRGP